MLFFYVAFCLFLLLPITCVRVCLSVCLCERDSCSISKICLWVKPGGDAGRGCWRCCCFLIVRILFFWQNNKFAKSFTRLFLCASSFAVSLLYHIRVFVLPASLATPFSNMKSHVQLVPLTLSLSLSCSLAVCVLYVSFVWRMRNSTKHSQLLLDFCELCTVQQQPPLPIKTTINFCVFAYL